MTSDFAFNHVGLCVSDLARSRVFYENALGFEYWWQLNDIPDDATAVLLQLDKPVGLTAMYLVLDGFVLELLEYAAERLEPWRNRSMAEPGLTHMSISVADLDEASARVEREGGTVIAETRSEGAVMVRDPDGQLIELLTFGWRDMLPSRPA